MATRCQKNNDNPHHNPDEPLAAEERTPDHEQHRKNRTMMGPAVSAEMIVPTAPAAPRKTERNLGGPRRLPEQIGPQKFRRNYHDAHQGAREATDQHITSDTGVGESPSQDTVPGDQQMWPTPPKIRLDGKICCVGEGGPNRTTPIPTTSIQYSVHRLGYVVHCYTRDLSPRLPDPGREVQGALAIPPTHPHVSPREQHTGSEREQQHPAPVIPRTGLSPVDEGAFPLLSAGIHGPATRKNTGFPRYAAADTWRDSPPETTSQAARWSKPTTGRNRGDATLSDLASIPASVSAIIFPSARAS